MSPAVRYNDPRQILAKTKGGQTGPFAWTQFNTRGREQQFGSSPRSCAQASMPRCEAYACEHVSENCKKGSCTPTHEDTYGAFRDKQTSWKLDFVEARTIFACAAKAHGSHNPVGPQTCLSLMRHLASCARWEAEQVAGIWLLTEDPQRL